MVDERFVKFHSDISDQQRKLREKGFDVNDVVVYVNPADRQEMYKAAEWVRPTEDLEVNGSPVLSSPDLPEGVFAVVHRLLNRYPEAVEIARFSLHEEPIYVVEGFGRFPENGIEIVKAFQSEDAAHDYIENGNPDEDAGEVGGWEVYGVREVPLRVE